MGIYESVVIVVAVVCLGAGLAILARFRPEGPLAERTTEHARAVARSVGIAVFLFGALATFGILVGLAIGVDTGTNATPFMF